MDYQQFLKLITEQTPDFYNQTIQWGFITGWAGIGTGFLLLVAGIISVIAFIKTDDNDGVMMASIVGGCILLIALLIIGFESFQILECAYYPKAYFIEAVAAHH